MMIGSENEPIIINISTPIMKATIVGGERLVEVECSNQTEDSEGDIILQSALLKAGPKYIKHGHVDLDHYSEIGRNPRYAFLGIKDPESFIIGYPTNVFDMGDGRTGLKVRIKKNEDGISDPDLYKWDMFWDSLQKDPPTRWFASVYGFPGNDTEEGTEAKRFLVKSFDWKSTAFTRTPVNETIIGTARVIAKAKLHNIITAKSYAMSMLPKAWGESYGFDFNHFSRSALRSEYWGHLMKGCTSVSENRDLTVFDIRDHYIKCRNMPYDLADMCALATVELFRE